MLTYMEAYIFGIPIYINGIQVQSHEPFLLGFLPFWITIEFLESYCKVGSSKGTIKRKRCRSKYLIFLLLKMNHYLLRVHLHNTRILHFIYFIFVREESYISIPHIEKKSPPCHGKLVHLLPFFMRKMCWSK